jgi:hypothetical protein
MKSQTGVLLFLGMAFVSASSSSTAVQAQTSSTQFFYSFETSLQGWTPRATDVADEGCSGQWSVTRSSARATHGTQSLRFSLNNCTDAGKIWAQRTFVGTPGATYRLRMSFDFASADFGDFNNWSWVAAASSSSPGSDEIMANAQGDTGNGAQEDVGYQWLHKEVSTTVTAGPDGRVVVYVGVWGTYEVARTYYVDSIWLEFSRQ